MSTKPSPFVWHDLITTDVEAAKTFYAQVIGWHMQSFPGNADYTVLSAGSTGIGGIMAIPPEACVFIIFKPQGDESMPSTAPTTPGLVGRNELHAVDGLKTFDWYADMFGWTKSSDMDMGPMGIYRRQPPEPGLV